MDDGSLKRRLDGQGNGSHKAPKLSTSSNNGKMSFAERMMAKMGYKEGSGLGKDGEGMLNPIEVKQRPQGAGVGTVKEKTEQYKQEQRRAAEKRGEEYEDSSEEERKARRAREKKGRNGVTGQGASKGASALEGNGRPKTKYRTLADVQAAAPGLEVPQTMLGSILDATGSQTKLLTSTSGLFTSESLIPAESEAEKIAKRERLELEAFIDAWHGVLEQKVYVEEHEGRTQMEIEQRREELEKLEDIIEAVDAMTLMIQEDGLGDLLEVLAKLEQNHQHDVERYDLSEIAVGAVTLRFKRFINEWDPLSDPGDLVPLLTQISTLLGLTASERALTRDDGLGMDDDILTQKKRKSTTPYETLIYSVWLPKMRTTITNWQVLDYGPLIAVVNAWRPLLPAFIYNHLLDQLIVPRLKSALQVWDPRKRTHHHKTATVKHAQPHTWLFPWLRYLPLEQMDLRTPDGLLNEVKRRLRHVLDSWNMAWEVIPGIGEWKELLGSEFDHLLVRHLLPRLARFLSINFEINPAAQDPTPLHQVLAWQDLLKADILARLLAAEFFPKWLSALHEWLTTGDADFDEIGQWIEIWRQQMPEKVANHPDVLKGWSEGDEMLMAAASLAEEGKSFALLPAPAAGPVRPIAKEVSKKADAARAQAAQTQPAFEPTEFRDIVDSWCAQEDLTLVPLREAHPSNGQPLFRMTASASGKGGVVIYLKGDIIWAQRKGDRASYDPIGMDEKLLARAEGR